jgi:hypothetical protein
MDAAYLSLVIGMGMELVGRACVGVNPGEKCIGYCGRWAHQETF